MTTPPPEYDYIIVGAGLAGLTMHHMLDSESVLVIDPNPGGYKIGESVVPEQFRHPELRALLPAIRALPSFSPKHGTTFVSHDSVASFPLPAPETQLSMHVARHELEDLVRREWDVPICEERVLRFDLEAREVETDGGTYRFGKQLLDCSGPAMLLGRALGLRDEMWSVHAAWRYMDIAAIDDEAFWNALDAAGKSYRRYDVPAGRVLDDVERGDWRPSISTTLTHLGDGRWSWQIPLYDESLLSFGVVSRHGPVSVEELDRVIAEQKSPQYTLRPHPESPGDHFGKVYQRGGIAQRARQASGESWILVGDAHFFADPVYSVGTALAINQAIEVATLLNEGGWDAARSQAYNRRASELADRAIQAYQFWYDDAVTRSDQAAQEVQCGFLVGSAFQVGVAEHYGAALSCARLADMADPEPEAFSGRFRTSAEVRQQVTDEVAELLQAADGVLAGWSFRGAHPSNSGVQLDWASDGRPQLTMLLSEAAGPSFRRVGPFALSYQSLWDGPYPMDAAGSALFDRVAARLRAEGDRWHELLARYTVEAGAHGSSDEPAAASHASPA